MSSLLSASTLPYFLICLRYSKLPSHAKPYSFSVEQFPVVSFIVPIYNECEMIESRIDNFNKIDYPAEKLEVVIVDGGSNDGTAEALEKFGKNANFVLKVINQGSRNGFNPAVIEGFHQTTGDIIFITGAEVQYASNSVKLLVNHFADPEVGAVNGTLSINNMGAGVSVEIEVAYRTFYDFLRDAESKMDMPFDIKGEIAAARRSVCQKLISQAEMHGKGCIDACFSFQAKADGLKTVFDSEAVYSESAPTSLHESFKQQIRRAATLIQNLLLFKHLMFKSKNGLFGSLIMPVHFAMLIILPILLPIFRCRTCLSFEVIDSLNLAALSLIILSLIGLIFSQGIRAFFKVQIASNY